MLPKPQTVYRVKRKTQQHLETFEAGEKFLIKREDKEEGTHYRLTSVGNSKLEKTFIVKKGQFNYAPLVFEEVKESI